jgi:hypothetical protein
MAEHGEFSDPGTNVRPERQPRMADAVDEQQTMKAKILEVIPGRRTQGNAKSNESRQLVPLMVGKRFCV